MYSMTHDLKQILHRNDLVHEHKTQHQGDYHIKLVTMDAARLIII